MTLAEIDITGFDTILLDRDGTINRQRQGDYVKNWDEFEFLPGALIAIARFTKMAKHVFIVTNQRGVGRSQMSEEQLIEIHTRMLAEIKTVGGRIDRIYYSTGIDDFDYYRKPNIGMWEQIQKDFPDVEAEKTLMIGDSDCDMVFAQNCGIRSGRVDKQDVILKK